MGPCRVSAVCLAAVLLAGCSKSPSAPSDSPSGRTLDGQTVSAVDGGAAAGLTVQVGRAQPVTTDGSGYFEASVDAPGSFATTIKGSTVVEHQTMLSGPTDTRIRVSLIPSSFDLSAFDQMFRTANSRLQRWTSRPSLVIVTSVMGFRGGSNNQYTATSEQMSDDEVAQMTTHLTEGLALLTGGTYTSFASVQVEHPAKDERVLVARSGKIVVGRYTGIVGFSEVIGYGNWQEQPDGSVTGGSIYLDRDFDKNDGRRRLLRIHELGHALGYTHVTSRTSVMNPAIGPEPTEFDRTGAIVAFQRPPGNVSPDVDPGSLARTFSIGGGRWVDLIGCR